MELAGEEGEEDGKELTAWHKTEMLVAPCMGMKGMGGIKSIIPNAAVIDRIHA